MLKFITNVIKAFIGLLVGRIIYAIFSRLLISVGLSPIQSLTIISIILVVIIFLPLIDKHLKELE